MSYRLLVDLSQDYGQAFIHIREQSEAAGRSEARLAGIIHSAMDAIISINQNQEIVLFNESAEKMFGLSAAEAIGQRLERFIPQRHREGHAHHIQEFGHTGATSRSMGSLGKLTALRADGQEFPIEAAISQLVFGGQTFFTVILRDVTAQRRQEESLIRANQALESLVDACPLPVIALDHNAHVSLWNRAAEDIFGWSSQDTLGQPMPHIPQDAQSLLQCQYLIDRSLKQGEKFTHLELKRLTKDGRLLDINLASAPLYDGEGNIRGMIGISTDVTERKRWEKTLQQAKEVAEAANHAKDHFLAVLSHELRTPLTPVLSIVGAWEEREELSGTLRADLALIRRNVELEARLIDDMLDLTRISKGKLRLNRAIVDVHASLRHSLEIVNKELEVKRIRVELRLDASHHFAEADPARLQQIFWNLLKNAIKFTPEEGTITLKTRNQEPVAQGQPSATATPGLVLEISDTGIGITPEVLPRIFDAFEQGEQSITRKFGGLGLGLAISRMLVLAHGGQITAESAGKNQGARFLVTLPTRLAPVPHDLQGPMHSVPAAQRNLQILLVEDHEDTARVMSRLLNTLGYHITTAGNVTSALALAAQRHFDLIISDIGLPDGTGLELMRQIQSKQPLRGIALSGFGMDADIRNSHDAGFAEHLTKPIDFRVLDRAIQELLSTPLPDPRQEPKSLSVEEALEKRF